MFGTPNRAAIELIMTMLPRPRPSIPFAASRDRANAAETCVCIISPKSMSVTSTAGFFNW